MAHDVGTGAQLGQYVLGERLAVGGMAEIYHAHSPGPQRFASPFVIKRMHERLSRDDEFVEMFIEEARISSHLDHPNIVHQLDFQATEGGLYIVLEYVDGPDLLMLSRACAGRGLGGVSAELAVYILCHTLEALDYAHNLEIDGRSVGLVHRDVTPGNILISKQGKVLLTDFGVACVGDRQRQGSGALKGKYAYMSPEQIESKVLDGRSDVFSAGAVLAELLMGHSLFWAPNPLAVLLMARSANLERLETYGKHIDSALLSIIKKSLERERNDRYGTAAEFRDALTDWLCRQPKRTGARSLSTIIAELDQGGYFSRDASEEWSTLGECDTEAEEGTRGATDLGREVVEMDSTEGTSLDLALGAVSALDNSLSSIPPTLQAQGPRMAMAEGRGVFSASLMPLELLGVIAMEERTGKLELEQGLVRREAFFDRGHPVFVTSNVPGERFGQFLVAREFVSPQQLEAALAAMPKFGGQLGQALVGLGFVKPVDAVQLLARQVAEKLVNACCWESGRFVWTCDVPNPHDAVDLSSYQIVLKGTRRLPQERLLQWVAERSLLCPTLHPEALEHFAFGPQLKNHLETLDGRKSLGALMSSLSAGREILAAVLYAMTACSELTVNT